jgi:GH25 family lysozyme M1 (1,4-beta-N-acetylmuramidase)
VSKWQADIDWKKVKNAGIDFAMIKSSQGGSTTLNTVAPFTDPRFKENIVNAYNVGLKCGVYHYMTGLTINDVIIEADYLLKLLEPYKHMITFPVAIDIEHARYCTNEEEITTGLVNTVINKIRSAGYTPILYSYKYFLKDELFISCIDCDIWEAVIYKSYKPEPKPADFEKMTIWQYSDKGLVDGISGYVDMDVCYKDYTENVLGDIDGDGKLSPKDALIVKRIILGTYTPTETEKERLLKFDKVLSPVTYLKLKRMILGEIK